MGGGSLVFAVNGERFEISKVDHPSTTLLQFLRSQTPFQSVKLSCGEGGCGACVVLLSKYDPVHHKVENYTINSCLTLVCSIHGCSITTTEGLGSQKTGFHPIHQRLAGFHAAQCGYCTPGISVSLFSALLDSDKSNGVGSSSNISNLTVCEAEKAINGNLCRCTGYRPIADACKSFAADVDIEDLGLNTFWKNEEGKEVKLSRLPIYDPSDQISVFPDFLKNEIRLNMLLDSGKYSWHTPLSIEELEAKLNLSESKNLGRVKLVASNTGTGYYKELDEYDTYIDLRCIPELSTVKKDAKGIQIGAAVSISKAIIALKEDAKDGLGEKISAHFEKIASLSVRYDWGALSFDIKLCKTNHTSKTAMRAPGRLQGSFIAEAVIEHVASTLFMDVDVVREKNFHTFDTLTLFYDDSAGEHGEYTLPSIWDKLALSSNFHQRKETIKQFNSTRKWSKRGISRIPIIYGVNMRPTPGKVSILSDGSIAVEVGGIELGQGLWTKVKQMAAFALSSINCAGSDRLLDKVRVIQADTLSMVQGGLTAGSTTSESSCEAVRICCNTLVERLIPVLKRLEEQMGSISWETLISKAHKTVNMSASTYFVPDFSSIRYLNYGASVSEVEVNLLTGETTILRSDIIYDCGKSLNPAVDLGQIEGAFVQGIGFFMLEEYLTNPDGLVVSDSTWTYKIPTIDTVPRQLNVEIMNSGHHQKRVLSSKASGEPPVLLAASVHCATRAAIKEARKQLASWGGLDAHMYDPFHVQLSVPATMPVVKELCGLDIVEKYLNSSLDNGSTAYT